MKTDADWLIRVRKAVEHFRVVELRLAWIDLDHAAPEGCPDYYRWHPNFAVELHGVPVGELSLAVHIRDDSLLLSVDRLLLLPIAQRRGFASALQAYFARRLPEFGIERVRLVASDAGSYAWARLGYDFDLEVYSRLGRYPELATDQLRARVRAELLMTRLPHGWNLRPECGGGVVPAPAPDSVRAMLHRLERLSRHNHEVVEDFTAQLEGTRETQLYSAEQIALCGRDVELDGMSSASWLGREVMIRASWSGVRTLSGRCP